MTLKPSDVAAGGIRIPGGIIQVNDESRYPTHYADFGFGGLRTVTNLTDRANIPLARQEIGMLAYVESSALYFKLVIKDTPDPNDPSIIVPAVWEALQTGGGGQTGAAILEIKFLASDWVLNAEKTQLMLSISHDIGTENLNVDWYQDGFEGTVFVPWVTPNGSTVIGCIPVAEGITDTEKRANAFTGLIRISSTLSLGDEFTETFARTDWQDNAVMGIATIDINHKLQTLSPGVEVYDSSGNESMVCITIIDNINIILTVFKDTTSGIDDTFAGYVYVKG